MIANLTEEINAPTPSSVAPLAQPDLIGFITDIEPTTSPMEHRDAQSDLEFQEWGKGKGRGNENEKGQRQTKREIKML